MGCNNVSQYEVEKTLAEEYNTLLKFHGEEKTLQIIKFAKLLCAVGQTDKALDIVLKAANKNWSKKELCQKNTKSKLLNGFRLVYPLLGSFLKLLKKL